MARQEDTVLLTGLVGGLSYYKTKKGGYFVRRKSGVSRERIMSDPAFAPARENIAEFRRATLAAKLIRRTFAPLFERGCDKFVSSSLTGRLVKVIQGDTKNPKGQRRVMEGNVPVLAGFGMNRKSNLSSIFRVPFATSIDRIHGTVVIDIPSFAPAKRVAFPSGATHYRLRSGGASIDFETDTFFGRHFRNLPAPCRHRRSGAVATDAPRCCLFTPSGVRHPGHRVSVDN